MEIFKIDNIDKYYDLLAFYDCLNNLAYANVLRNHRELSDTDHALLCEGYKEVILLIGKKSFLEGNKDICQAIDNYLIVRLPRLGAWFSHRRTKEQRVTLAIDLLMREHSLHAIKLLLHIIKAITQVKTPRGLQIWDQITDEAILNSIIELRKCYVLFERYPPKIGFANISNAAEKQLAVLLGLHHATQDVPSEIYLNGKTQFYLSHHLLQSVHCVTRISSELPLVALPEVNVTSNDSGTEKKLTHLVDTITEALVTILEACARGPEAFALVVSPTIASMAAADKAFSYARAIVLKLPRHSRNAPKLPDSMGKKIAELSRWIAYRERHLESSKQKIFGQF